MTFPAIFFRFRWLQLPVGLLVLLLQRTPVLRLLAAESPGFGLQSAAVLKSAFSLAALGAYNSVAGATVFNAAKVAPTTVTPSSGSANTTFRASGAVGSAFSLSFNGSGAPSSMKSWRISGTLPAGLSVVKGTASGSSIVANGSFVTLSGTPTAAFTGNLTVTAYESLNAGGQNARVTCAITITGAATTAPVFTTDPASQSVTVGSGVTFTAVVTGSPTPTLQWFKGTTALTGKTSATLSLTNVQLSDAGDYSVLATNSSAPDGIPSDVATLVVDPAATSPAVITPLPTSTAAGLGDTVTLSVTASGTPSPTFSWRRGNVTLPDQSGPSLTVGPLTTADAGTYTVTISNSAGQASSTTSLSVSLPAPADLTDPGTLKTGSSFTFDLSGGRPPVSGLLYKITGLPAGLKLDSTTGLITGVITAKPGTAKLTAFTQLGKTKSAVKTATLVIGAFPTSLVGAYEALMFTTDDDALPVGKVALTVSPTGSFTGTLLASEVTAFRLKNQLVLAADNSSASLSFAVARGKTLPPYTLSLTVSSSAPAFSATLGLGSSTVGTAPDGDRLATAGPTGAATAYTALLTAPVDLGTVTEFPKGTGYATAKIDAKGVLTLSGKLADGSKLGGAYPLGRDNRYRVFTKPYPKDTGGYFAATLPLSARQGSAALWHVAPSDGADSYWRKPDPLAATTSYGSGFGPLALTVRLEPWIKPSTATPLASLLGLDSTGDFAVAIAATSLSPTTFGLPSSLRLDAKNLVSVVSATTPANPAAFTAKVNPTTGALTGGFTLAAIPPVALRKVAYTGVLLQPAPADRPGLLGSGFFLLPAFTKGGEIYSGQVELTTP